MSIRKRRVILLVLWGGCHKGVIYRDGVGLRDPIRDTEVSRDLPLLGAITTLYLKAKEEGQVLLECH